MKNIFFSSDLHLGHQNSWEKFKNEDGSPLRPFTSTEDMNEEIIERHNAVVSPQDTWYCLGDVAINKKFLHLVKRMNGHKRLVRGNHDIFDDRFYNEIGFEKIYGVRVFTDHFICSHIPLREEQITERFRANLHGHLHGNFINSPIYLSVCVERINYTPLHFDEIDDMINKNKEYYDSYGTVKY